MLKFLSEPFHEKYKILTKVIGDSNSKVRECEHIKSGKKYAVKILPDETKSRQEAEIHYVASGHPNIVKLIEVYNNFYDGSLCILLIMELLTGGELFERIQKQKAFTEKEASNIINSICSAVSFLHKNSICHRDIKPENLIYSEIGPSGILKLCDFGFSKRIDDSSDTLISAPMYTPYYSSPEVLNHQEYGKSCDIWAIGVITYMLLCGYPPFFSTSGKPISPGMKERIKSGKFHMIGPEWDRVSGAAKNLIGRCLVPDTSHRITIEKITEHKWINYYNKNPETPLITTDKFVEKKSLFDLSNGMEHALAEMRIDSVKLKNVDVVKNSLLERRRNSNSRPENQFRASGEQEQ